MRIYQKKIVHHCFCFDVEDASTSDNRRAESRERETADPASEL